MMISSLCVFTESFFYFIGFYPIKQNAPRGSHCGEVEYIAKAIRRRLTYFPIRRLTQEPLCMQIRHSTLPFIELIPDIFWLQFQIFTVHISHPFLLSKRNPVRFFSTLSVIYENAAILFPGRIGKTDGSVLHMRPQRVRLYCMLFFCHCHTPSSSFLSLTVSLSIFIIVCKCKKNKHCKNIRKRL